LRDTCVDVQDRVSRLRRGLDAFNESGVIGVDFLAPDFEMHQASSIVDTAGLFRGRGALAESLRELQGSFDDLRFDPERFIEAPTGELVVLVRVRGRGRGSGVEIDNLVGWVFTFRGHRIVRLVVFEEPDEALEAAGVD
jgi:ketosteroid isomerase-like protein